VIEAVLFDIDGTLVDSNEQHVEAWVTAFETRGHPIGRDAIRQQIGKGGDLLVPALLPGASDDESKALAEAHGHAFKERYLDGIRAFPSAREAIARAHGQGLKVVLASSAKREELEHYVELLGVGEMLDASTSIDDVSTSKPAPDIFSAAIDKIDVAPARAIVVGDTPYDVEAAKKAGIAAIGLTSGPFDADALTRAGAIAVYANIGDLIARYDQSPLAR
jgi:HAD superfamily hydrolase (TIGR01509 family)